MLDEWGVCWIDGAINYDEGIEPLSLRKTAASSRLRESHDPDGSGRWLGKGARRRRARKAADETGESESDESESDGVMGD